MENQLPTEFDLIVVGTGMVESILSAAASRVGKNVLHIDSRDYYGGQWASFNLKTIHNLSPSSKESQLPAPNVGHIGIGNKTFNIKNFETKWHVPETTPSDPSNVPVENPVDREMLENEISAKSKQDCETTSLDPPPEKFTLEKEYTQATLLADSRKFNIDFNPKLHFARGQFVELLISSNIARYAEYRSVSRVLTYLNGQLEVVPCSRSDVFANNRVSVIEKRMLMKLLTTLDEIDETLRDDKSLTFKKFLSSKKLSENLIHFILYAMARGTSETSLAEGLEQTKQFLDSLGRFGKTPFLFSMYGSGETPQAFCRLSAVFGGTYALNQESLLGLKVENNSVEFLQNGDQEIKAAKFVFGVEYCPEEFVKSVDVKDYIARAIFITNQSVLPTESEHLTLLMYPPDNGKNIVTIIEMGSLTGTCPKNLFLVHLTSKQVNSPKDDFQHIVKHLFNFDDNESNLDKPKIMWSCYFSLPLVNDLSPSHIPENMFICGGPDLDLDYNSTINQAKNIFKKMYPDLDFLPRAPDPEEIIIGDGNENSCEDNGLSSASSDVKEISDAN